jgi:hypothetical protein
MLETILLFWSQVTVLTLVTFGIVSILLSGSIFKKARDWWQEFFKNSIMKDLSYCALCLGMWISLFLQWYLVDWINPIIYFLTSCAVSGIVWILYLNAQNLNYSQGLKRQELEQNQEKKNNKIGFI